MCELDDIDALRISTLFGESGDLRGARSGLARAEGQVRQASD